MARPSHRLPPSSPVTLSRARVAADRPDTVSSVLRRGCRIIGLVTALAPCPPAGAAEHVWLIGGGYDADDSEAQIEQNVIWAEQILKGLPGERQLHVYFTDGDAPYPDVKEWRRPLDTPATLQPLARVLNAYWTNGNHYRNHRVPDVAGPTDAGYLSAELRGALSSLHPGDQVLLVFNGHGGYDEKDTSHNTIWLWDSTSLDVNDVEALLDAVPAAVPVRFVFTQCYAGAFSRLASGDNNRCGFMAEAEDRETEGCSASLDLGDYRDYSTYFFAALAGHSRTGSPLVLDPDRNHDGTVTLREAHLYTLEAAHSEDLPRSTSEVFLEHWLPWYLGWAHWLNPGGEDNEYSAMARRLAQAEGLAFDAGLPDQIRWHQRALKKARRALRREEDQLNETIDDLRQPMEDELLKRWPEATYPYTANVRHFLEHDADAAQSWILSQPNYLRLVESQDGYWDLEASLLDNARKLTQLDKIQRLAWLGRLRNLFDRFASPRAKQAYQRLLSCEDRGL